MLRALYHSCEVPDDHSPGIAKLAASKSSSLIFDPSCEAQQKGRDVGQKMVLKYPLASRSADAKGSGWG